LWAWGVVRNQGELLADEIVEFYTRALPKWYGEEADAADLSKYPAWLQTVLANQLDKHFETLVDRALQAVWDAEEAFVPPRLKAEMDAIAEGMCSVLSARKTACDVDAWKTNIYRLNMIPEFVKMTCTMFGAWGPASASGNLLQLRALDFGESPFSNFTVLQVHRPAGGAAGAFPAPADFYGSTGAALPQAFASLSLPALVGVITGVSESGVGLSEKVWEVYNTSSGVQDGHYDGEADVLVMRDILELAENRAAAEEYMRNDVTRTWAIFIGVGDFETQRFDIVGYREADFHAYTPETMPAVTGGPMIDSVVYVDRHPQPSTDGSLPLLLQEYYGELNMDNTRDIVVTHGTGDMHIAVYDFGDPNDKANTAKFWWSIGRIDEDSKYVVDEWMARSRPFLEYNMADLWAGK
jgi:hypothetical protein